MTIWLILDIMLICVIANDDYPMLFLKYLTNQVWIIGIMPKILIWLMLLTCFFCPSDLDLPSSEKLFVLTITSFLTFGVLQAGVLTTFFALLCFDSSMFEIMITQQDHKISTVVLWNHIRHVTPVFLHLIVLCALQAGSKKIIDPLNIKWLISIGIGFFCVTLGLLHVTVSCDSELYMYKHGNESIDWNCRLVFLSTVACTITYFLYGVL